MNRTHDTHETTHGATPGAQEPVRPQQQRAIALPKAPKATNDHVRKSMQGNKRRDTKPELLVRKMLREMGYPGYRLDWKKAKGHPDIAYPGRKVAIFVMGCFWHHHEGCRYATTPKQHADYWQAKFARNQQRDVEVRAVLKDEGWTVVEVWECELKKARLDETRDRLHTELSPVFDSPRK